MILLLGIVLIGLPGFFLSPSPGYNIEQVGFSLPPVSLSADPSHGYKSGWCIALSLYLFFLSPTILAPGTITSRWVSLSLSLSSSSLSNDNPSLRYKIVQMGFPLYISPFPLPNDPSPAYPVPLKSDGFFFSSLSFFFLYKSSSAATAGEERRGIHLLTLCRRRHGRFHQQNSQLH